MTEMHDDCGCCDGVEPETPQPLANRAGLPAIRYRIGDYEQFRASLHAALSSSEFPALGNLRTRDARDFTIGLLDAFACAADVLTFYQERLINESFLGTAVERVSLQELGKLVAYTMRPGVAAETWLALALETPPAPPQAAAPEPGAFVSGVPDRLSLEAGLRVQSVPGPDEKPQTFETIEALPDARPIWNAMRPWLSETRAPQVGDPSIYLSGVDHNLRPGDALLFVGKTDQVAGGLTSQLRLITSVNLDPAAQRTRVDFAQLAAWSQQPMNVTVHVFRQRAALFGHNAIDWLLVHPGIRKGLLKEKEFGPDPGNWPQFDAVTVRDGDTATIDLDTVYPDITRGSYVVLARGPVGDDASHELCTVSSVSEISRFDFALSAKVTRVALRGAPGHGFTIRETTVYAANQLLKLDPFPVDAAVSEKIPVAVESDGLVPGRRLIIRGVRAADKKTVVTWQATLTAVQGSGGRPYLEITPPLPEPLVRESVVVFGNVVPASHGESVSQVLGSGNAGTAFQRFELAHRPLTERAAPTALGVKSELTLRVSDIAWQERATLFGSHATDQAFTLETDEQGIVFVVFGDGARGARPASGANNIRVAYRVGLGIEGNVAADKLTQLVTRPLGLKSVSNPIGAQGGTDPESIDTARQSIPLTTRTLDRAVSVLDYEDFARAFAGIAKAQARVVQLAHGPTIAITVAAPVGAALTPASPVWTNLLAALRASGDPHVEVRLLGAAIETFRIGMRVKCDARYEARQVLASVEATLRTRYAFEARELSAPVIESEVITIAQRVPGVIAVDLTFLYRSDQARSKQARLLAAQTCGKRGSAQAAELLILDPLAFDPLEVMP